LEEKLRLAWGIFALPLVWIVLVQPIITTATAATAASTSNFFIAINPFY
jgi:hypothetical protein